MISVTEVLSLLSAFPTSAPSVSPTSISSHIPTSSATPRACGEVNVFYTGFPPYHPLVIEQGWDPARVDAGLRGETVKMINAGYNVHVVWAGLEVPISELEERMDQKGVEFDMVAIGYGIRGARLPLIVERLEELVEMYHRKAPNARKVFNYDPESTLWSVTHRMPMTEDCEAAGKPGKLLGYEEICDTRCDRSVDVTMQNNSRDEL